jgi:hypothetical protein
MRTRKHSADGKVEKTEREITFCYGKKQETWERRQTDD